MFQGTIREQQMKTKTNKIKSRVQNEKSDVLVSKYFSHIFISFLNNLD
jgi:hypothetical protein